MRSMTIPYEINMFINLFFGILWPFKIRISIYEKMYKENIIQFQSYG